MRPQLEKVDQLHPQGADVPELHVLVVFDLAVDEGSAPPFDCEQPLHGEHPDCLAQRRAGNPEFARQLNFIGKLISGLVFFLHHNLFAQCISGILGQTFFNPHGCSSCTDSSLMSSELSKSFEIYINFTL